MKESKDTTINSTTEDLTTIKSNTIFNSAIKIVKAPTVVKGFVQYQ